MDEIFKGPTHNFSLMFYRNFQRENLMLKPYVASQVL